MGTSFKSAVYIDADSKLYLAFLNDDNITPTKSFCQYLGNNIAKGKSFKSDFQVDSSKASHLTDNDWNLNGYDYEAQLWRTVVSSQDFQAWFAIDLEIEHFIRMFRLLPYAKHSGNQNRNVKLFAGNRQPVEGQALNEDNYSLCGGFEIMANNVGSPPVTVTCQCLVKGRYAIALNGIDNYRFYLSEVAVYGYKA